MRPPPASAPDRVGAAVAGLGTIEGELLLAVSGGIDSMVLLHAAAAEPTIDPRRLTVATFDHGTGRHATAAAALVARTARALGLCCVSGRASAGARPGEAAWRAARWAYLAAEAAGRGARVVTAHTRDDQVETVLFRVMRNAGARGIAGLQARSDILRPLLDVTRAEIASWARRHAVSWEEDPTNRSPDHARNRLRHDLLPALRDADPELDDALVALGSRAARWREEIRAAVSRVFDIEMDVGRRRMRVAADDWTGLPDNVIALAWQELLSRLGIAADWRGTRRLAAFTTSGRIGTRMPLSGGWVVRRTTTDFTVERQVGD